MGLENGESRAPKSSERSGLSESGRGSAGNDLNLLSVSGENSARQGGDRVGAGASDSSNNQAPGERQNFAQTTDTSKKALPGLEITGMASDTQSRENQIGEKPGDKKPGFVEKAEKPVEQKPEKPTVPERPGSTPEKPTVSDRPGASPEKPPEQAEKPAEPPAKLPETAEKPPETPVKPPEGEKPPEAPVKPPEKPETPAEKKEKPARGRRRTKGKKKGGKRRGKKRGGRKGGGGRKKGGNDFKPHQAFFLIGEKSES